MAAKKPELPTDHIEFPEPTITWYNAWRDSPLTDNWGELQWQYMYDTALVHACIWENMNFNMMGELRGRLREMGLTFEPPKASDKVQRRDTPLDKVRRRSAKKRKPKANI